MKPSRWNWKSRKAQALQIGDTGFATGTILNDDYGHTNDLQLATGEGASKIAESQTFVVPNLLHRSQIWQIPNLPDRN